MTIERPASVYSDVRPGWTLRDWPDVVDAVVNDLGLNRYAVSGRLR